MSLFCGHLKSVTTKQQLPSSNTCANNTTYYRALQLPLHSLHQVVLFAVGSTSNRLKQIPTVDPNSKQEHSKKITVHRVLCYSNRTLFAASIRCSRHRILQLQSFSAILQRTCIRCGGFARINWLWITRTTANLSISAYLSNDLPIYRSICEILASDQIGFSSVYFWYQTLSVSFVSFS